MFNEILEIIGAVVVVIYVISLLRVCWYERKIKKLYKEKSQKIEEAKNKPILMPLIEREIRAYNEQYQPKIEELERKRRFIIEKLPFIKK